MQPMVLGWLVVGAFAGDTLAQQNGWAAYESHLDDKVAQVNAACGAKLTASYDHATYPAFDPIADRTESACLAAVGTLSALCATDPGKQVVRKLASATCRLSTTGTGVTRAGAALTVNVDPANSGITGAKPGSYSWKSALEEIL
ncbi:MAG: hypothetical protein ABMB14_32935 [Myxococcota bacterium]